MTDRTMLLAARLTGGLGLGALLLYGGYAIGQAAELPAAEATLWLAFGLALAVAGAWAIARSHDLAVARWAALAITGALPVLTFLAWAFTAGVGEGLTAGVLWLNLVAGVLALGGYGWLLTSRTTRRSTRAGTLRV